MIAIEEIKENFISEIIGKSKSLYMKMEEEFKILNLLQEKIKEEEILGLPQLVFKEEEKDEISVKETESEDYDETESFYLEESEENDNFFGFQNETMKKLRKSLVKILKD